MGGGTEGLAFECTVQSAWEAFKFNLIRFSTAVEQKFPMVGWLAGGLVSRWVVCTKSMPNYIIIGKWLGHEPAIIRVVLTQYKAG